MASSCSTLTFSRRIRQTQPHAHRSMPKRRSPPSAPATRSTSTAPPRRRPCCSTRSSPGAGAARRHASSTSTCEGPGPHLAPEMAGHFRHRALFIGPNARAAVNEGRADYVPVFLSDVPRLFESGALPLDAVLRQRDAARRATASARSARRVEAMHAAIRAAKTVIVQLNAAMPRTLGESFIHVDEIDLAVEVDVPPYVPRRGRDRRRRAADRRARRGARPGRRDAPARASARSRPPTAMALTRQARPRHPHRDVHRRGGRPGRGRRRHRRAQGAQPRQDRHHVHDGHAAPVRFVHDNPMVEMRLVDFTNDTHVIRSFSRMVAINSAIEVDLTGQVVADSIGHRMYSRRRRPDGLHPRRGAGAGGRSIIALPSTAARRARARASSRRLREGAGVVTTRAHVRTVVTEWGVAELFGRSLRERAAALIAIAHPDLRDQLRAEARWTRARTAAWPPPGLCV